MTYLFVVGTAVFAALVYACVNTARKSKHKAEVNDYFERINRLYPNSIRTKGDCRKYKENCTYNFAFKEYVFGIPERDWSAEERKIAEERRIKTICDELKTKYPKGYRIWMEEHGNIVSRIESDRDKIRLYDEIIAEETNAKQWLEAQKDFASHTRNALDTDEATKKSFGCYSYIYSVGYRKLEKENAIYHVHEEKGDFKVWQFFYWAYCADRSLDYSLCKYYSEHYDVSQELLKSDYSLNPSYNDKILELIKAIGHNAVVLFASSGLSTDVPDGDVFSPAFSSDFLYFHHLQNELNDSGIKYTLYGEKLGEMLQQNTPVVVIELVSSHEQMRATVEKIISRYGSYAPVVAYISVMKEHSTEEMTKIIDRLRKEKEEKDKKEKEERLNAHTKEFKAQREEIMKLLENNGIKWFYHFTDRENIESIKKYGGLFSWKYCRDHGIEIPNAGGNDVSRSLDVRHNLQDFVRLSFCSDHPMAYRKECEGADVVFLRISVEVATFKTTVFSDMNATDNAHCHGTGLEDLQKVDFDAVKRTYVSREDDDFKAHQAEVKVKTFVPLRYILNINDF